MVTETYPVSWTETADANANPRAGIQGWPTNAPPADPVSGGTLSLWQFGQSPHCLTEIFQSSHTVLTPQDKSATYSINDQSITFGTGSFLNGLLMGAEVAGQSHFISYYHKNYAHLEAFFGNATSTSADSGWMMYNQSPFANIRFSSKGGNVGDDLFTPSSDALGKYIIVGISHTATSRQIFALNVNSASRTGVTYPGCSRPVGVGNVSFPTSYSAGQIISAVAQVNMSMTQAQLTSVCKWLAGIEKSRGLPVYA